MITSEFLNGGIYVNIALFLTIVLSLGVIFVNGWTDAPNAIATAVSTRVLRPNIAIGMAVVMNFLGVLVMTYFNAQVAETISNIVTFDSGGSFRVSQIALAAALFSIVVWTVAAWYFGIPTSESHALIAGLTGAAMALGGLHAVNGEEWLKVFDRSCRFYVDGLHWRLSDHETDRMALSRYPTAKSQQNFYSWSSHCGWCQCVLTWCTRWPKIYGCLHVRAFLQQSC